MAEYGLLGKTLGHSYSPAIHAMLADYPYHLYARSEAELPDFLLHGDFRGLNVTIPYKKAVIPYCAQLSPEAARLGSVNVLLRRDDGTLYGDNTDAAGFAAMVTRSGMDPVGKKALVLGSGGAGVTAAAVLRSMGAGPVVVISRTGENNYENLHLHADAGMIINATPVGMYPNCGSAPVDLSRFPRCRAVLDVVYNPARTALLLQAEALGLPHAGGLYMLVAQAKRTAELFLNRPIADSETDRICRQLSREMQNIVLIGMPGCGKSTIAGLLGQTTGRRVLDSDAAAEERAGMPISRIFAERGEASFRTLETAVLDELGKSSGCIIATGGGAVTRRENYPLLHRNGVIVWLRRDIDALPTQGRPVSQSRNLHELAREREPLYRAFADHIIDNSGPPEGTVRRILEVLA